MTLAQFGLSISSPRAIFTHFWPKSSMRNSLRAYLQQKIAGNEFMIHYHIGNDFSGETDFRLQGDGSYHLWSTVTQGYLRKSYSGQVAPEQVRKIAQDMLNAKVWRVKHTHPRGLDDPDVKITVFAKGQKSGVVLWLSEVRESLPFAGIQQKLLEVVHRVSEGEVLENGM